MLGFTETLLIVALIAMFFFGKKPVMNWVKTIKEAKQELSEPIKEKVSN